MDDQGVVTVIDAQPEQLRVLLIEDDLHHARLYQYYLEEVEDVRIELEHADRLSAGFRMLGQKHYDAVLLDLGLPDSNGLETFYRFHKAHPQLPVVVSSGLDTNGMAAKAVKDGAEDYLVKDRLDGHLLARTIRHAVERAGRRRVEQVLRATNIEMDIARQIQQGLYPKQAPHTPGYDIAGLSQPCAAVGGDYYDFIQMPDGSLGIAVGDASGHGLGPALMMAQARATLRTLSRSYRGVDEILTIANEVLCESVLDDHFFTLLFAQLDPDERLLAYSSAGHPTGLVLDTDGEVRAELPSVGLPLGVAPDVSFERGNPITLHDGDTVVFYSDGLLEAECEANGQFGVDGIIRAVRDHRDLSASDILQGLHLRLLEHCRTSNPPDDITSVVVKVQSSGMTE